MYYNRNNETNDILISVLILTISFTLMITGGITRITAYSTGSIELAGLTGFAVTVTAFLLHEMAHRTVARKLGAVAFFKLWPAGVLLALITSMFGFLFGAPGAVEFAGLYDQESEGKIALAGPATNIVLGVIFYVLYLLLSFPSMVIPEFVLFYVALLNLWFALFNLLPIPPLDGSKVFYWNSKLYAGIFILVIVLNFVDGLIPSFLGIHI